MPKPKNSPLKILRNILFLVLPVLLMGCATLADNTTVERIANSAALNKSFLKTKYFTLTSYYRFSNPGKPLNIYIEGDGHAWLSRTQLSDNPTPRNPLVLELTAIDPSTNVAYLARPGQYTESGTPLCKPTYWSDKRFSEEVITSMNEAIDQLSLKANSKKINLIGYSGGAAIAVLVTARRTDVISIRTIAGNLDHQALSEYHHVSLLEGSLNPINYTSQVRNIPMRHFVSPNDRVIPSYIVKSFAQQVGDISYQSVTEIKGATHFKGWQGRWKELLREPLFKNG